MLNRLLFSVEKAGLGEKVVREILKLFPKPYRRTECLSDKYLPFVYDLISVTPSQTLVDNEGNRIAGSFAVSDMLGDTPSPAIWSYYIPIALFSALALSLFIVALVFGLAIPKKLYSPALIEALATGGFIDAHIHALQVFFAAVVAWNALPLLPLSACAYFVYIVVAEYDPSAGTARLFWLAFWIAAVAMLVPFFGPLAGIVLSAAVLFLMPVRAIAMAWVRRDKLRMASNDTRAVSLPRDTQVMLGHVNDQIDRSLLRSDPLIVLGRSMGVLRRDGDPATPDAPTNGDKTGGIVAMDCGEDMELPLIVYGRQGTSKTVGLIGLSIQLMIITGICAQAKRDICAAAGRIIGSGILWLDAKGDLPLIFAGICKKMGITDFLLVTPETHYLNLFDGFGQFDGIFASREDALTAALGDDAIIVDLLFEVLGSGVGGSKDVWQKAEMESLQFALNILSFLKTKRNADGTPLFPDAPRCMLTLRNMVTRPAFRAPLLKAIFADYQDDVMCCPALETAYHYWAVTVPGLAEATRSSIEMTLDADLAIITSNPRLQKWLGDRSDINITQELLAGKFVAPLTSEAKYGAAGLLAAGLIEAALFNSIKRRPIDRPDWKKTEYPVTLICDEWGSLASERANLFSMARSIGLRPMCFLQNKEQLINRFGSEDKANAIEGLFKQRITYDVVSEKTIEDSIARIGTRTRFRKQELTTKVAKMSDLVQAEQAAGVTNKSSGAFMRNLAAGMSTFNSIDRKFSSHDHDRASLADEMERANVEEYKEHTGPTISKDELTPHLNGEFVALVQLTRAKYPRREVVRMLPYWELYPQLGREGEAALQKLREERKQALVPAPDFVHPLPSAGAESLLKKAPK